MIPSSSVSFGFIEEIDLKDVISLDEFQAPWNIAKDDVEICRDCEYRHMCMDCRVFIDEVKNKYSRPSSCSYNPYLGKWKGEKEFLSIEDIGKYVDGRFVIDFQS